MAWSETLLDASFRGVPFHCETVNRAGQRAIAVNEFPYRAGAELEDLNISARAVRLRAVFFGADYEMHLADFISALESPGAAELIHPIHGSMMVLAASWDDDHDADSVDAASVSVIFVEDGVRDVVFGGSSAASMTDAIASGADDARGAADDALARFIDGLSFDLPRFTLLTDAFGQARGFLGRILGVTGSARLLLSDLDPLLYPRAYAADLYAMVDRAFQGLPFGGRNLSFVSFAAAAYGSVQGSQPYTGAGSPYAGVPPMGSGSTTGTNATAVVADYSLVRSYLDPVKLLLAPNGQVLPPAQLADIAVVQAHARVHAASAIAEAVAIVLAGELDAPLLNRTDIEQLTGQTRGAIQVAIDDARAALDPEARGQTSVALAALAYRVQEAARAVVNQRPPLLRRASPITGPLRLVAHAMYGSAARATELAALNALGRHVLIDQGEVLYAYAR